MRDVYFVFCDGACSGNPGPGGWGAIIQTPMGQVVELGGKEPQSTNNRMEMKAALESMQWIINSTATPLDSTHQNGLSKSKKTKIYTDSQYLIKGMTQWMTNWRKRGWKNSEGKPVLNQDLWEALSLAAAHLELDWVYVPGHSGVSGNERADQIASSFAQGDSIRLFHGDAAAYSIKLKP